MKIGFDISQTGTHKAGCGYFAESLITHLSKQDHKNHYLLYQTFGNHYWDHNQANILTIKHDQFSLGLKHSSMKEARLFWEKSEQHIENKLGDVDIIHANNYFCPPRLPKSKLVYTLYDLSFIKYPACTTEHNRIFCFDNVFNASLNADFIIAISEYTKNDFLTTFPHFPNERMAVIYPGNRYHDNDNNIEKSRRLPDLKPKQFWLNVGTIEPRKNIKRLLHTYAALKTKHNNVWPLVLAGQPGWGDENIHEIIHHLGIHENVHILGYTHHNDLQWLYKNCFCFIYPSLFEGFGLPVLEAMGFGAPIISSNTSSIPEIVKNAGILIDPTSEDELMQAMTRILNNHEYRENLGELARTQAKAFTWDNTARKMIDVYENRV